MVVKPDRPELLKQFRALDRRSQYGGRDWTWLVVWLLGAAIGLLYHVLVCVWER